LIIDRETQLWTSLSGKAVSLGTVGAVALDAAGNLAAGTSTGGTLYKHPGRVGDSALVGCGCYADNAASAVSTTGHGESIMKVVLAKTANDFVASGKSPHAAADAAIELLMNRTSGRGGLIILDRAGHVGFAFSTADMAYAYRVSDLP
jgi:beta-aspartyl-peptidase (threonine type)